MSGPMICDVCERPGAPWRFRLDAPRPMGGPNGTCTCEDGPVDPMPVADDVLHLFASLGQTTIAEEMHAAFGPPTCPRGCESWERCDEPQECSADNLPGDGERHGAGVCVTRTCIEPCGRNGGCSR